MKTRKEVVLAAVAGLALGAGAAPKYQATITASGYAGSTTLTNFPVLVSISSEKIDGFAYSQCATGGRDLSFADEDGRAIPYEIDTWDTSGESLVWVKVPTLKKNTTFMMRWGDKDPPSVTASDVWADYVMVWHLDDATDAETLVNSSPSGSTFDAVPDGSNASAAQSLYFGTDEAAAPIGGARCLSETNVSWKSYLKMTNDYSAVLGEASKFTLSTWVRATDVGSGSSWFQLFKNKAKNYNDTTGFWVDTNLPTMIKVGGNGGTITEVKGFPTMKENWVHVVVAYNGTKATVYGNGQKIQDVTVSAVTAHGPYLTVACGMWGAWLDEFRFMKGAASADWAKADYDTVKKRSGGDAFLSCSAVQNLTEDLFVGTPRLVSLGDRSAVVSLAVVKLGADATKATVTAAYGTSPNALSQTVSKTVDSASTCELTLSGLMAGRRYYVALTTTNDKGESVASPVFALALPSVQYQATITASGYAGTSTLKNFPVLVRVSEAKIDGFKYSQCAADGRDLSFVSADGLTTCSHEIDTWNPEGESLVWVKLPTLEKDTKFLMCWGDKDPPSVTASDVWANYVGVWHLGDAADAATCANSSPYGATYDAVPSGTGKENQKVYAGGDAPVGRARCFSETPTNSCLVVSNYNATGVTSYFTVSTWIRGDSSALNSYAGLFNHKTKWDATTGWYVEKNGSGYNSIKVFGSSGNAAISASSPTLVNWVLVAAVYDGSTATLYCNGTKYASGGIAAVASNDLNLSIGGSWAVSFDECRLMKGAASADWVKADYDTMTSATFLVYGAVVQNKLPGFLLFIR